MRYNDVQQAREAAVTAAKRAELSHQQLARLKISESIRHADAMTVFTLDLHLQGLEQKAQPNYPAIAQEISQIRSFVDALKIALNPYREDTPTVRVNLLADVDVPTVLTPPPSRKTGEISSIPMRGEAQQLESLILNNRAAFIKQLEQALANAGFTDLEYLSEGGMAIVIKAREEKLGRDVVIKINKFPSDPKLAEIFIKEGKQAAQIGPNPNIVTVYRTETTEVNIVGLRIPMTYHVFEYVEGKMNGKNLIKRLQGESVILPVEATLMITRQLAKGISAAHEKGVIHRDLKPENALVPEKLKALVEKWISKDINDAGLAAELQKTDGVKVSDFGLAIIHQECDSISQGAIIGTPGYIPPEALDDASTAGQPWDVYSLGIMLYELLTGKGNPFKHSYGVADGAPVTSYIAKMSQKERSAIAGPEFDPEIQALLEKNPKNLRILQLAQEMTAYKPEDRPTMAEVVAKLDEILDDRSQKSTTIKRMTKWVKGLGAALIIGIPATFGAFKYQRSQYLIERRETFNTIQGTFQATGKRCYCHEIEAMEKLNGGSPDPDEVPTEEQYQAMLKCLREKDIEVHPE